MYPLMQPPLVIEEYSKLTKKEAQQHFDWFISQIPQRIEILKKHSQVNLNRSPESLIHIWEWFHNKIEIVNKTAEELEEEFRSTKDWLKNYILVRKMSMVSLSIILDIAIYFGEVIRENNRGVYWEVLFKPKSYVSVNRPILGGFRAKSMDVVQITSNKAILIQEGDSNTNALYDIYNIWTNDFI